MVEKEKDAATLEAQLQTGAWLTPPQVAVLFGRERQAINRWLKSGKIRYRVTPGGHYECHPGDVQNLLDQYREERRAGNQPE